MSTRNEYYSNIFGTEIEEKSISEASDFNV